MGKFRFGTFAAAVSFLLLSGCVTYPYQSAFAVCDNEAGACYQYCEQFAGYPEDYGACHRDCEEGTDRCFADAYDTYAYSTGVYTSSSYGAWPWYGRYGNWGPQRGYYFDFTYFDRYPQYRQPRPNWRYRDRPWQGSRGDGAGPRRPRGDGSGPRRPRGDRGDGDGRRNGNDGATPRNRGNGGADRPRRGNPDRGGRNDSPSRDPQSQLPEAPPSQSRPPRRNAPPPAPTQSAPPERPAPQTTPPPRKRTAPPLRRETEERADGRKFEDKD